MAAELEQRFGVQVELVPGDRGAFEVLVDDAIVFSKSKLGRFPEHDEIFSHLQ